MGCGSCASGGCSTGGCKNNGGCKTGGCNKLNTFDWLAGMEAPSASDRFSGIEVRFKGGRKEFYRNTGNIELHTGDGVVVETPSGLDLGFVSLQGELVRLQMKKKGIFGDTDPLPVIRKATPEDLDKFQNLKSKELPTLYRTREIINDQKLQMKLSDVEFQFDGKKATFYYSADDRVDFRELIKILATEFKLRIEMKQISLRQESGRLGGIGVCGRELCCSTWLTDFKSVNTSAARYQNLSLNPQKLSGQCGRLKCCLNYELDTYMDALKDIPSIEAPLFTISGEAVLQKTDIFRKIMWFSFNNDGNWHAISTTEVIEIIALNKKGIKPNSLSSSDLDNGENVRTPVKLNNDIQKLDDKFKNKNRNNNHQHNKKRPDNRR